MSLTAILIPLHPFRGWSRKSHATHAAENPKFQVGGTSTVSCTNVLLQEVRKSTEKTLSCDKKYESHLSSALIGFPARYVLYWYAFPAIYLSPSIAANLECFHLSLSFRSKVSPRFCRRRHRLHPRFTSVSINGRSQYGTLSYCGVRRSIATGFS
jgi:hypothetical protein